MTAGLLRRKLFWRNIKERTIYLLLFGSVALTLLTTVGIILSLATETFSFFQEVSIVDFLTDTRWTPLFSDKHFGILPLIAGSTLILVGASIVALPIGLASAIYLSVYANPIVRRVIKPLLEILAGIPTVVYGYFALSFVTPLLRQLIPGMSMFNALSASIVVGIMIIPMVSSLSEDALIAVPRSLREAGFALGATRFEVATKIVLPAGLSGVIASFILAISRAIGETMIVALAAGSTPKLTLNPLESIQTMTAYIVQVSLGDTPQGTTVYKTIFAVGTLLFIITLMLNIVGQLVTRRYREVYE
ncbi:MAG: phosphate ABC transporter permease subunit PstC [Actinomycetota bacterium]|nr:phosphate ABC transporter permease subunit PstC [Actinomycetota bacterium]